MTGLVTVEGGEGVVQENCHFHVETLSFQPRHVPMITKNHSIPYQNKPNHAKPYQNMSFEPTNENKS